MRRIQAEAIDRRLKENETRGIKDPCHVKEQIARKDEIERLESQAKNAARTDQISKLCFRLNNMLYKNRLILFFSKHQTGGTNFWFLWKKFIY
jgi:hypothetical protein